MTPRVLIMHAGGTIGMQPSGDGYRPMPDFDRKLRDALIAHAGTQLPEFDIVALAEPIDSANVRPSHWTQIGRELLTHWDEYSGFVILHGTDTLAWSASALSFMLRGTDKPVILTGAQIPLVVPRSDALSNLESALLLATRYAVSEVGVFFGRQLLRGNRSSKLACSRFEAFGSPNCPALADVGIDVTLHTEQFLPPMQRNFSAPDFDPEAVTVLTIHPGVSATQVDALHANPRVRGLILRSYGVGNAPDADRELMASLARAANAGVVILNTTQCLTGAVAQETYSTGAALARLGVVSGADMTLEAAFTKLHYLLATDADCERIRRQLAEPLCGELTRAPS